jgi:hypothetical protein
LPDKQTPNEEELIEATRERRKQVSKDAAAKRSSSSGKRKSGKSGKSEQDD